MHLRKRLDTSAERQTINLPTSIQARKCKQGVNNHFHDTAWSIASDSACPVTKNAQRRIGRLPPTSQGK